ncbi:MAG: bifunctional metallophosphatase/5'-nucleotidase, partial [Candidatus Eisenbacteria bacterium]|nr:bifunctional metallophosphatase/5'-nucleotidase [Candidatus Latescibacterota bacterium]MBD3303353.1 bifunctional metallophosphatase/5'-nucleotidase [Candidatus Eisenbacteria bacterium]
MTAGHLMRAITRNRVVVAVGVVLAVCVGASIVVPAPTPQQTAAIDLSLTALHKNDGESRLIDAGEGVEDSGGIPRFGTLVQNLRIDAVFGNPDLDFGPSIIAPEKGVALLNSGDHILVGPIFSASIEKGIPFYDTIAPDTIGYDAFAIGIHEFDFTPDTFADFVEGFEDEVPFLSANLDYSDEPRLQALADAGIVIERTAIDLEGTNERIGVVGATTSALPS